MGKNNLMVRLTDDEKERREYYAQITQVSRAEVIQDYCKGWPQHPEAQSKDSLPLNYSRFGG